MMYHHVSAAPNAADTMAAVAAQYWAPMAMASASSSSNSLNHIQSSNLSISSNSNSLLNGNRNQEDFDSITKNLNFYSATSSCGISSTTSANTTHAANAAAAAAAAASFLNYPANTQDYVKNTQDYMKNVIGAAAAAQWAASSEANNTYVF